MTPKPHGCSSDCPTSQLADASRRRFLLASGLATTTVVLKSIFPGRVSRADEDLLVAWAPLPEKTVAALTDLKVNEPILIEYPDDVPNNTATLVRIGTSAGGGVGPDQDIVAFSTICTHMGGDLAGEYNKQYKVLGPCREHLTTFDLSRHGMVVAGHATASLPQLVLKIEDGDIIATGIIGVTFGHHSAASNAGGQA